MSTKKRIYSCLLVVLALLVPLSAVAYNKSWDQGHLVCVVEPGTSNWGKFDKGGVFHGGYTSKECCDKYCKVCPVYANTGKLQESYTDLSLNGVGPSLTIKRTYDSQDWATSFLGKGWTFNFGKRIIVARRSDNEKIIGLVLETGEKNYYIEHPDGSLERLTGYGASFNLHKNADGSYTIQELDGSRTEIMADGKIDKVIDRNNNQLIFDYNPVGCVSRITNASGNYIDFQLGPNGKIASATDNFGRSVSYDYDANGNLIGVTDPIGHTEQYVYNGDNLLTQRIDARGSTFETINYDSFQPPRVASFTEKGETFNIAYFADRTEKTDSQGNTWTYYYNDVGIIERTIDPLGNETRKSLNKVTATSVEWEVDANGNRTSYTYDTLGNVTSKTDALGNTWEYTYVQGTEWLEAETNPLGVVTKYEYDANGSQTKVIWDFSGPLEYVITYAYDAQGNQISVIDALRNNTTNEYDSQGNITKITDPLGNVTVYTYDVRGNRLTETDANSNTTTFEYEFLDRLVAVTDAKGNTTSFQYDANGNLIAETDAQGNSRTMSYDAYNRMTYVKDVLGTTTTYAYDWRDNLIKTTDTNNNTTSYVYDVLGRRIRSTNALGEQATNAYDAASNLTMVIDENGNTTTFAYDVLKQRINETHADGAQTNYTFDSVGNLKTKTYPNGNTTIFSYDRLNRVVTKTYTDGSTATFSYDILGRLNTGSDSDSTLDYTYDAKGRVTQAIQNGKAISYSYDGVGNRTSMTTPEGEVVQYSYDEVNLMISVHLSDSKGITYNYDILNRITRKDYTGGSYSTYAYDAAGRPTQIDHLRPDNSSIYSQGNTYDVFSNILAKTTGLGTTTYAYDDAYQLIGADHPTQADEIFTYDATGNRLSSAINDSWRYNNRNQLLAYETVSYTYDDNGNTLTKTDAVGSTQYSYDHENRLVRVDLPDGSYAEYKYDVLGRRTEKNASGTVTSYIYDNDGLLSEYNELGVLKRTYIRSTTDINPSFWKDSAGIFFYHHDHLSTPQAVTAEGGALVWNATFKAFGQTTISVMAVQNNVRFPGQYFDEETGLYYNWYRYYDSETGRYIQSDPIGLRGGLNTYLYVRANPINLIDPLGLCWSNARAVAHYTNPFSGNVTLAQTGCVAQVSAATQVVRNAWKASVKQKAENTSKSYHCPGGGSGTIRLSNNTGVHSGVFWIGGISLFQKATCSVKSNCSTCKWSYNCAISNGMNDRFENPFDFDNSNNDWWDDIEVGRPFNVTHTWSETVSDSGKL